MARYTDYCTCFYDSKEKRVYFWDEITDRKISTQKVKDFEEVKAVMRDYTESAPVNIICQCLDRI